MTNSYLLRGGSAKASTTTRDSGSAADTWQITIMVNNFNQLPAAQHVSTIPLPPHTRSRVASAGLLRYNISGQVTHTVRLLISA